MSFHILTLSVFLFSAMEVMSSEEFSNEGSSRLSQSFSKKDQSIPDYPQSAGTLLFSEVESRNDLEYLTGTKDMEVYDEVRSLSKTPPFIVSSSDRFDEESSRLSQSSPKEDLSIMKTGEESKTPPLVIPHSDFADEKLSQSSPRKFSSMFDTEQNMPDYSQSAGASSLYEAQSKKDDLESHPQETSSNDFSIESYDFIFPITHYKPDKRFNSTVSLVSFEEINCLGIIIEEIDYHNAIQITGYSFSADNHIGSFLDRRQTRNVYGFKCSAYLKENILEKQGLIGIKKVWPIGKFFTDRIKELIASSKPYFYCDLTGVPLKTDQTAHLSKQQRYTHNDASYISKILADASYIEGLDIEPFKSNKTRENFIQIAQNSHFSLDQNVYSERGGDANLGFVSSMIYHGYSSLHRAIYGDLK